MRRVTPSADGAPIHQVFTVSPDPDVPTVYTVEIPAAADELAAENNTRSVLVPPQTGRRKILILEGAPGYEHTFLKRALGQDPGLDVDAVVRKGQNDDGRDTFYVQAAPSRMAALSSGYPATRSELFAYDAVIFGNIEADFFTRDQLALTSAFVAERGGGLLVLGARSFDRQGLAGTALEHALPVDLTDRRGTITLASATITANEPNTPALTVDGLMHPATRLSVTPDENRQKWAALPALASVAAVGGARPGAQVLAVALTAGGNPQPLIAAQRYGQGRSMVFAGEASWRWRMMRPATDNSYETIWRQLARWITAGAQGPVTIAALSPTVPGITDRISVFVRDEDFRPVANAEVAIRDHGAERREAAPDGGAVEPAGGPLRGVVAVRSGGRLPRGGHGDARDGEGRDRVPAGAGRRRRSGNDAAEVERSRAAPSVGGTPTGATCMPTGADHLPSLLRESRADAGTPEAARPLAQWVEPRHDHRPAGRGMGDAAASRARMSRR